MAYRYDKRLQHGSRIMVQGDRAWPVVKIGTSSYNMEEMTPEEARELAHALFEALDEVEGENA